MLRKFVKTYLSSPANRYFFMQLSSRGEGLKDDSDYKLSKFYESYADLKSSIKKKNSEAFTLMRDFPDKVVSSFIEELIPKPRFALSTDITSDSKANDSVLFFATGGTTFKQSPQQKGALSSIKVDKQDGFLTAEFFEQFFEAVKNVSRDKIAEFKTEYKNKQRSISDFKELLKNEDAFNVQLEKFVDETIADLLRQLNISEKEYLKSWDVLTNENRQHLSHYQKLAVSHDIPSLLTSGKQKQSEAQKEMIQFLETNEDLFQSIAKHAKGDVEQAKKLINIHLDKYLHGKFGVEKADTESTSSTDATREKENSDHNERYTQAMANIIKKFFS